VIDYWIDMIHGLTSGMRNVNGLEHELSSSLPKTMMWV